MVLFFNYFKIKTNLNYCVYCIHFIFKVVTIYLLTGNSTSRFPTHTTTGPNRTFLGPQSSTALFHFLRLYNIMPFKMHRLVLIILSHSRVTFIEFIKFSEVNLSLNTDNHRSSVKLCGRKGGCYKWSIWPESSCPLYWCYDPSLRIFTPYCHLLCQDNCRKTPLINYHVNSI